VIVNSSARPIPASVYGVAALGHAADARKLRAMRLPDLAARSAVREFSALAKLLLASGHARAVDQ
jgi:hypothetical protein